MSGPTSLPMANVFNRQYDNKDPTNQQPVVGPPLKATYLSHCRLCLSDQFGESCISVKDEQFKNMLNHVFRFPITFQKGLPLNVCTKCYKGVELFYRYTFQVLANQKTLEDALIPDKKLKQTNTKRTIHEGGPRTDSNQGRKVTNVIRIGSDGFQKEMKDYLIDVDMQCENALDDSEDSRESSLPTSNYEDIQTHFVAVPGVFLGMEIDDTECMKKTNTKPVEDAPFVIEIISASDDEFEVNAKDESVTNHTTSGKRNRSPVSKLQFNERTSSQAKPVAASVKNVSKLEKPKTNLVGGITVADFAKIANRAEDGGISSKNIDKTKTSTLTARRGVRNTFNQQNATKETKCFP